MLSARPEPHETEHDPILYRLVAAGYNTGQMPSVRNGSALVLAAAETLPFGVAITDPHGIVTWANSAYAQLTGCTSDELPGQSAGEFPWDALSHAAPSCQPWPSEAVCRRKTGESYTARHTITPLRNPTGELMGFCLTKQDIVELNPGGNAPHQAEEHLAALIESTEDLIWSVDLNYRLLTFNRAWYKTFERSFGVRAAVGMGPEDLFPPERAALWPPLYERALTKGPFRVEHSLLDGRTLEMSFNPILHDGRTRGLSVFGKDITERKLAEKTLREAENQYRSIFENAVEGIYRASLDGKALAANLALAKMLGYDSPEEGVPVVNDTARQVWLDPNERSRFVKLVEDRGVALGYECQFKRKDGTVIWVSVNSRIVCDVDGQPLGTEGFVEDITERKRMEDSLRKSEEKLSKAFRCNPAATLIYRLEDEGSRLIDVNEAFELVSGYRREEAIGRTTKDLGFWVDLREYDEIMKEFRATGKLRNVEHRFRRKNGEVGIGLLSAELIELDGKPCGISETIDITERKRRHAWRRRTRGFKGSSNTLTPGIFESEWTAATRT